MKTLVFAVAGYNLAETGRMIEIAKEARKDFDVIFASYGGQFEELIKQEGFTLRKMGPRLTEKKLGRLRKVLSGQTLNTLGYLSVKELRTRVPREIAFFEEVRPAAVLTGWCLSVTISARAAKTPLVNVLHSTSVTEYYEAVLGSLSLSEECRQRCRVVSCTVSTGARPSLCRSDRTELERTHSFPGNAREARA